MAEATAVVWVIDVGTPVLGGWADTRCADAIAVLTAPGLTSRACLRFTDAFANFGVEDIAFITATDFVVALAFAFGRVEIIIIIISGIAIGWNAVAVAVVLVPGESCGTLDRGALALTVGAAPVEVVWAVFGATDACAKLFVPDFVGIASLGRAFAFTLVVQVIAYVALCASIALASARGVVPVVASLAGIGSVWFTALACTHLGVEAVSGRAFVWLTQAFAGVGVEVLATWAVFVGASAFTVNELLADWAGERCADARAAFLVPSLTLCARLNNALKLTG